MLLPLIATGLSLGQGLTTLFGDEVLVAFGRDAQSAISASVGSANSTCLVCSLTARAASIGFFTVLTPVTAPTSPSPVIRQASIWAMPSLVRGGTTAGVEFGSVFHDVDGGDHSLMRGAPDSNNWYPASRARCRSSSTWAMRSGVLCLPRLPLRRE